MSVFVFLLVSIFGCESLRNPAEYEGVNHIMFPSGGSTDAIYSSYNGQSDCMQMQADLNAPFAQFLSLCVRVVKYGY